jgi:hypothetical protein
MDDFWNAVRQDYEAQRYQDAIKKLEEYIQVSPNNALAY